MASHLKGKTDAECRALAGHYYARATRAEREREDALQRLRTVEAENARLRRLAYEMADAN